MSCFSKLLPPLLAALAVAAPAGAQTWDGIVTGKISGVDTTGGLNLDFRIFLDGSPVCGAGTPGFAYMNHDFDNYQATTAVLLTAWAMGKTVTLHTTKDANGFCQVGYVAVTG